MRFGKVPFALFAPGRASLLAAVVSIGVACLVPVSACAQVLQVDVPIIGVSHSFDAFTASDTLTIGSPSPASVDLSLYTSYALRFHAPVGQQIVVTNPSTGGFDGSLFHFFSAYSRTTGTVTVTFEGYSGLPAVPGPASVYTNTAEGFLTSTAETLPSAISFTAYTVTTSNLGSGRFQSVRSQYNVAAGYFFYSAPTDPGAFVFLQNVPAAVPEPGSVALLVGLGAAGAGFVRCRVKVRNAA